MQWHFVQVNNNDRNDWIPNDWHGVLLQIFIVFLICSGDDSNRSGEPGVIWTDILISNRNNVSNIIIADWYNHSRGSKSIFDNYPGSIILLHSEHIFSNVLGGGTSLAVPDSDLLNQLQAIQILSQWKEGQIRVAKDLVSFYEWERWLTVENSKFRELWVRLWYFIN